LIIAAAVAGFALPAFAADMTPRTYTKAPPVVSPATNWSGFYMGIHGGWGFSGSADRTVSFPDPIFPLFPAVSGTQSIANADVDGGLFGAHIGFNWQYASNWLVGLEASFTGSGVDGTASSLLAPGFSIGTDVKWLATVTPRWGYVAGDSLWYIKGGLAAASVDTDVLFAGGALVANTNTKFVGWTLGAGVEWMFAPNWVLGIEYNYYDLGSQDVGGNYSTLGAVVNQNLDLTISSVLARLSYKFGDVGKSPVVARY
jgi:outer membrane immunogenic protein